MPGSDEIIYVLLASATAGVGNAKTLGDRHPLIVLVREDSAEKAQRIALEGLARNFWELPEIKEVKPLNPKLGLGQNMEAAISDAAVHGISFIVYDDPIPKH